MNPLRIKARNYRTFEELDLDLPAGCVAVVGDNGAGKSSIVNAIDLCLFGARSLADYLTDDAADTELTLELVFEHSGHVYRVRRGYSARGRGKTTLDLEVAHPATPEDGVHYPTVTPWVFEPLTRETAKATQAAIEEILGLSRETFRASAFLAQGDGAAFTEAEPRDRKRILAEVLGLDVWDRLAERARLDRRQAENDLERLAGQLEGAQPDLDRLPDVEAQLVAAETEIVESAADVASAERAGEALAARVQQIEKQRADVTQAELSRDLAQAKADELELLGKAANQARDELAAALDELAALTSDEQLATLEEREVALAAEERSYRDARAARENALNAYALKLSQRNALLGQASDLNEKAAEQRALADRLEQAGPGEETCRTCRQTLGAEALASTVARDRQEADDLDAAAKDLDAQAAGIVLPAVPDPVLAREGLEVELVATRDRLVAARHEALQRARLDERAATLRLTIDRDTPEYRATLAAAVAGRDEAERRLSALRSETPSPDELERIYAQANQVKAQIEAARRRAEDARVAKARAQAEIERIRAVAAKVEQALAERERLYGDVDVLAALEKAYGRDGIPSLIVEAVALPAIETEANRILDELGTSYRVELRTEELKKDGSGVKDVLDVVVHADAGERPYETFSGGERTRINLALRIALARLLAHRRGAESRLLAIDEPEFLDEAGVGRLADVLRRLTGDFERVLLISHVSGLRDAFDQTLEVVKDGNRSRVVLDAEPPAAEAIAA